MKVNKIKKWKPNYFIQWKNGIYGLIMDFDTREEAETMRNKIKKLLKGD
jgi:hypothetical protein